MSADVGGKDEIASYRRVADIFSGLQKNYPAGAGQV
jgi:hypothetical protein